MSQHVCLRQPTPAPPLDSRLRVAAMPRSHHDAAGCFTTATSVGQLLSESARRSAAFDLWGSSSPVENRHA